MTLTFEEATRFLYPRVAGGTEWSLEPTRALLERLGHPERHFDCVHIAGTNGKGSVAAMIHAVLRASGIRAGLYTSPHLVSVRERIVVGDRPITCEAFATWTTRLQPAIEDVGASFFEATTAIAFADFAARGAPVVVVEVGLGGRLDSTNVIQPLVSAVTSVTREHVDHLGDSLDTIAREKAGVAKPEVPFVIGEVDPRTVAVLEEAAAAVGARIVTVPPNAEYAGPLGLRGAHQRRNAAVAHAIVAALPEQYQLPEMAMTQGLAAASLPGRFTTLGKWVLDVAHNVGAMTALVATLGAEQLPRPIHALVGILRDKDWSRMIEQLRAVVDVLWLTLPPSAPPARRWNLDDVREVCGNGLVIEPSFDAALAGVQQGAATVVVTGSFHTVGDAMARLPGFTPLG